MPRKTDEMKTVRDAEHFDDLNEKADDLNAVAPPGTRALDDGELEKVAGGADSTEGGGRTGP